MCNTRNNNDGERCNFESQEVKLAMIALGKVPFFILGIAIMGIIVMMLGGIYLYYKKKTRNI